MISRASQVLPPLSDWDVAELCTVLPILSVILSSDLILSEELNKLLTCMISDLTQYALSDDNQASTRSAAASCVFSIIAKHQDNDSQRCLGLDVLKDIVCPTIVSNMERKSQDELDELEDALNFLALVGSAASFRGRFSSVTGDEVARFLALISCEGAANAPTIGISTPLDCLGETPSKQDTEISILAGTALGSMFNIKGGSPFAKQRLAHLVLPIILSSQRQIIGLPSTECGRLLCAAHIICNTSLAAISKERLADLMSTIVNGIEQSIEIICDGDANPLVGVNTLTHLMTLMIGTLLKVYEFAPSAVSALQWLVTFVFNPISKSHPMNLTIISFHMFQLLPQLCTIVPSLLLTNIALTEDSMTAFSLLSLQFLQTLTSSNHDGVVHFCETYKEKVISNLAKLLDHQSLQIRQATVQVINTWGILGA